MNFCASTPGTVCTDNTTDKRAAMTQPYPYFALDTPVAYIIGLYTNVANGGNLDDPASETYPNGPQYEWLVDQLTEFKQANSAAQPPRALLLFLHYPPYSGATDFLQRGDPTLWKVKKGDSNPVQYPHAVPIGMVLQQAFAAAGQRPDAVFSAHNHLYQRMTYTYMDGYEIPYLIVGSGGHATSSGTPEQMTVSCDDTSGTSEPTPPLHLVLPPGLTIPSGDCATVVNYNDRDFGFLRVTINLKADPPTLIGEWFAVPVTSMQQPSYPTFPAWPPQTAPYLYDQFTLILDNAIPSKHTVTPG